MDADLGTKARISRRRGSAPRALAFVAALALAAPPAAAQDVESPVTDTRSVLEQWVETNRVLSRERLDWKLGKEMLTERIDLVRREIASLRERIAEAEESIAEADEKRAGLLEENEQLEQAAASLEEIVTSLEARTRELLARLPEPIRERVRPLSQGMPEEGGETDHSLSERFQYVVGILNEVNKFNREITLTSEVRTLADGTTAEVTAMYVGIGHAYYTTNAGDAAGVGRAGPDGWTWTPANEAAPQIAAAIAILRDEEVAGFARIPVRIE